MSDEQEEMLEKLGQAVDGHAHSLWLEILKSFKPNARSQAAKSRAIQELHDTIQKAIAAAILDAMDAMRDDDIEV